MKAAWVLTVGLLAAGGAAAQGCAPAPLEGRTLYLRGSFNAWTASEAQRFVWACDRYELVTRIEGEHSFKVGDEGWNADADFGAGPAGAAGAAETLRLKGPDLRRRFGGVHRLTFTLQGDAARLAVEDCPATAPLGAAVLFMRGTMNNWAALDEHAFLFHCDAYRLNVKLQGRHEFRIADAQGSNTFGPFTLDFAGDQTLALRLEGGQPRLALEPGRFADPRARAVDDPLAQRLRFHSRSLAHKRPFGALVAGSDVEFDVLAAPGVERLTLVVESRRLEGNQDLLEYTELARVPMRRSPAANGDERFSARHRFGAIGIYGYWFEAEIGGRRFALQNNTDAVPWTREKGSGGRAAVGPAADTPTARRSVRRFRQTVYAAGFTVPRWASDIVYYQIFPERFRNGDPRNDPRPGRDRFEDKGIEFHADWNELPFKPGASGDAVYSNDFFGGDLAGIVEKLDWLKDLGVNTLYLTPVFKAASNHKYDTADYRRIDPAFGRDADFARLTREAARRGLRVIPDTSFNHVGSDSVYFDRYGNHGGQGAFAGGRINPRSPFASWFRFDPAAGEPDKAYRGWLDLPSLPEIDKSSPAFRHFAFGPRGVTQLWLDRGAAGWRMDVAPWVPDDFWRDWRRAVKAHKRDALTVAEAWFEASKYLLGDMFDSTMNYVFRNTVLDYAAGGAARVLIENLELLREATPPPALFAQMNLISSHDQPRALHVLGARDGEADAAAVALARQRLKLAVFLQMTYPGAPTVYYGDEVGVTGGEDPYNRKTYPWPDRGGQPDLALRNDFKRLIALRNANAVLRRGELLAPLFVDQHVMVFARRLGGQWAIVASSNATESRDVRIELPRGAPAAWRDALGGGTSRAEGGRLTLTLPPLFGAVLLSR